MNVRVEDLGPTRKKIHVVVPEEVVQKEIEGVYLELKKTAKVKGFRPGKTPRRILERYYGDYVTEQVISKLIGDTYEGALSGSKIRPVSRPVLENEALTEGEPFAYSAVVDVTPEIDVRDYVGIAAKRRGLKVEKDEITQRLDHLQNLHAQLKTIGEERAVRDGDFVVIDFEGFIDGRAFKGGKGEAVSVEIGAGQFLPDLEKALVGARCNEEKEVDITFPEDHKQRDLAGKQVLFRLKVKEIREKVLPPLDNEFAKDVGSESLEDLEKKVGDDIETEKQGEINREMERQILDALIEKYPFEVPESMVDKQVDALIRELKLNLAYQGVEFKTSGLNEGKLKEDYRERAIRDVKSAILLNKIAESENFQVTKKEIGKRFEEIASKTNRTKSQVEAYYVKNNLIDSLKTQLLEEKTLRFVRERAEVTDADEA
jgi:trigger factor